MIYWYSVPIRVDKNQSKVTEINTKTWHGQDNYCNRVLRLQRIQWRILDLTEQWKFIFSFLNFVLTHERTANPAAFPHDEMAETWRVEEFSSVRGKSSVRLCSVRSLVVPLTTKHSLFSHSYAISHQDACLQNGVFSGGNCKFPFPSWNSGITKQALKSKSTIWFLSLSNFFLQE